MWGVAAAVAAGADLEAQNELGDRPLHLSASTVIPESPSCCSDGVPPSAFATGAETPLHAAAFGVGDQARIDVRIEVARLLIGAAPR